MKKKDTNKNQDFEEILNIEAEKESENIKIDNKKSKIPFNFTTNRIYLFIALFITSITLLYYFNKEKVLEFAIQANIETLNQELKKDGSPFSINYETLNLNLNKNILNIGNFKILNENDEFLNIQNINAEKNDKDNKEVKINLLIEKFLISKIIEEKIKLFFYEKNNLTKENMDKFLLNLRKLLENSKIENNFFSDKIDGVFYYNSKNKIIIDNPYFSINIEFLIPKININTISFDNIEINNFAVYFENKNLKEFFNNLSEQENVEYFKLLKIIFKEEMIKKYPHSEKLIFFKDMFNEENNFSFKIEKEKAFNIDNLIQYLFIDEIIKTEITNNVDNNITTMLNVDKNETTLVKEFNTTLNGLDANITKEKK